MSLTFISSVGALCLALLQIVICLDASEQAGVRILGNLSERLGCVIDAIYAIANDGALKFVCRRSTQNCPPSFCRFGSIRPMCSCLASCSMYTLSSSAKTTRKRDSVRLNANFQRKDA